MQCIRCEWYYLHIVLISLASIIDCHCSRRHYSVQLKQKEIHAPRTQKRYNFEPRAYVRNLAATTGAGACTGHYIQTVSTETRNKKKGGNVIHI